MRAVAFVPSAPLLLLGDGPPGLRAAIDEALSVLTGEVVVVGASMTSGWVEGDPDVSSYGVPGPPPQRPLELAHSVGRHLLADRPHRLWGVPSGPLPEADSLLVVADGTAKRSEKAPGHFDPRAESFDAEVERALAAGDPDALAQLDVALAVELWATGVVAWRSVAVPGPWQGSVRYAAAPHGVGYVVATWTRP